MQLVYLHLCPGAVLPRRPCVSNVRRALHSGVESSVESPGLRDPVRRDRRQGNHPPLGRERSGLREREGGRRERETRGKVYFLRRAVGVEAQGRGGGPLCAGWKANKQNISYGLDLTSPTTSFRQSSSMQRTFPRMD